MKRIALTFLSIALGAAAIPAVAPAAFYDVLVCHAGPGNANHAFTAVNDNPSRLQAVDNCASTEQYTGGLYASDLLGSGFDTPEGQQVLWRMTAPAGLAITRWQSVPYVRNLTDPGWSTFFRTGEGTVLISCKASGTNCLGGVDFDPAPGTFFDWTVSTTAIEFGSRCDVGSTSCGNGSLIVRSLATLRSAKVTITDNAQPTVANVAGTLLAGGTLSGSKTVTFDASDASGISAVRLYIDGGQVQASSLACDFTYAKPCSDVTGRSFTVDTSTLADGRHTVAVGAVDAAGNLRQTSTTSFTTNNTPVTPPPSGGGGGGGGGGSTKQADPAPAPVPEPTVPAPPEPTVPVVPPQPTRPVTPAPVDAAARLGTPRWHESTLLIAGKLSRLATGSVKVTLSARVHGRTYTVTRTGRIRSGKWTADLRTSGPLAKAQRLSLRVSYAGNSRVKKTTLRRTISRR